jgi:hypothetical protein
MIKQLTLGDITFDFVSKAKYDFNNDCLVNGVVKNALLYGKHKSGKSTFVNMANNDGVYTCITDPNIYIDYLIKNIINNKYDFLIIDNVDLHYEKLTELCEALRKSRTQSILVTHNTFMMCTEYTRPDCIFIKEPFCNPVPLHELTDKDLRKYHNLEKLYRANSFNKFYKRKLE